MSKAPKVSEIPFLMKQWATSNTADPATISVGSHNKYTWECKECGYVWDAEVKSQYKAEGKCPCHESNKVILPGVNDVLTLLPVLKEYYDTEKNEAEGIDISKEGFDSKVNVNWKCPDCGRQWKTTLRTRTKVENGIRVAILCPHYNTVKRKKEDVPTIDQMPDLYKFWDKVKNPDASTVKANSLEYADWRCSNCGYEWRTTVVSQTKGTGKCACCELLRVPRAGYSDLFTLIPKAKDSYDFEKNAGVDIYNKGVSDTEPIWWKCPDCNHSWQTSIHNRVRKSESGYSLAGCRQCYLTGTNQIVPVTINKTLVKYWDFKKNKGYDINLTSVYCTDTVHWRCKDCGHTWKTTVKGMNRSIGCPRCNKPEYFITSHPELMLTLDEIFNPEENPGVDISTLRVNTKKEVHFHCKSCGHQWNGDLGNRIRKIEDGTYRVIGCPMCNNNRKRALTYSEQYPELVTMYNKNLSGRSMDSLTADESTQLKLVWDCPTCHRTFPSTLRAMIASIKTSTKGCPYCAHVLIVEGESFGDIHPELLDEYADENKIDPFEVYPNSKKEVLWRCVNNPDHTWSATFALKHAGGGPCPVCSRTKLIKGINTFADVHPEYLDMYSDNNERKPDEIFYNASPMFRWNCRTCHGQYSAYIREIISGEKTCPFCNDRLLLPGLNDFATKHPDLMKNYEYIANRLITNPDCIPEKSTMLLWWKCPNNPKHYYPMSPIRKLWFQKRNREACPECKGLRRKKRHFI